MKGVEGMELEYLPESYLSKEEFIVLIRVYEIIQKQNKKGGDLE